MNFMPAARAARKCQGIKILYLHENVCIYVVMNDNHLSESQEEELVASFSSPSYDMCDNSLFHHIYTSHTLNSREREKILFNPSQYGALCTSSFGNVMLNIFQRNCNKNRARGMVITLFMVNGK